MADLNKLNSRRATDSRKSVAVEPSTRESSTAERKSIIVRLTAEDHRALKRAALDDGTTIQAILESHVKDYLANR